MVLCTPTKKARIVLYREQGKSFTDIGHILGIDRRTVARNWACVHDTHDYYAMKSKSGRPKRLDCRALRRAARAITSGFARDATDLQRRMFPDVSARTVRRELCSIGLNGRIRRKKPFLTKSHVAQRKVWAKGFLEWTEKNWELVVFSDKSKFNLFGSDGRHYCRRRVGEEFLERNVDKKVKHGGGSLMVWGCITSKGTGRLHRIDGNLTAAQYCDILSKSLLGTLSDHSLSPRTIIFQQDNDPKHMSRAATTWFEEHNIIVLPWPPSSPDMNIIEHAWNLLDRRIRARTPLPQNLDQLWLMLKEEWERLDLDTIKELYRSMPNRLQALDDARGSYTKY